MSLSKSSLSIDFFFFLSNKKTGWCVLCVTFYAVCTCDQESVCTLADDVVAMVLSGH